MSTSLISQNLHLSIKLSIIVTLGVKIEGRIYMLLIDQFRLSQLSCHEEGMDRFQHFLGKLIKQRKSGNKIIMLGSHKDKKQHKLTSKDKLFLSEYQLNNNHNCSWVIHINDFALRPPIHQRNPKVVFRSLKYTFIDHN